MQKIKIQSAHATFFMLSTVAFGANATLSSYLQGPYVTTISAGPVWAIPGNNQTITLQSDIEKTYTTNHSNSATADGELFLGLQRTINAETTGQFGIAAATTSNAKRSGNIWDDGLPAAANYTYTYNVQHTHLAAKGKLLRQVGYFMPYISASIGVAWNNAGGFTSTPTIFEAEPTPNFASNTETSFTYTLGIGLQRALSQNWQVGIGYEFADWGQSQLKAGYDQIQGPKLALNHLYTNGLMFNLTYIA